MAKKPSQFLVIGLGRFGQALTKKLFESGAEVVAIDSDMEAINDIEGSCTEAACMDASKEAALERLEVDQFDTVIVCVNSTEAAIYITLLLKQMGAKKIITRAKTEKHRFVLEKIGADMVVFPEEATAAKVASMLYSPNMIDVINLTESYKLIEIRTPPKWANKTLMQIDVRKNYKINIVLIKRDNTVLSSPGGDCVLLSGDLLIVGGETDDLARLKSKATEKVNDEI